MSKYKRNRGPSLPGMLVTLFIAFGAMWYIAGSGDTPILPGFKLDREAEERRIRKIKACRAVIEEPERYKPARVEACRRYLKSN